VRRTLGVETNVLKKEALSVLQAIDHALGLSTDAVLGDHDLLAKELQTTQTTVSNLRQAAFLPCKKYCYFHAKLREIWAFSFVVY
jgi:hypothetical protein